jgi:hypothetical protein
VAESSGRRASKPGTGYGAFIGIAASALVVSAILIISQLEIYERDRWAAPSGEARSNNFYVLGKWLSETGHPVRFTPRWAGMKDIAPQEGGLFIQASLFDWENEDILPWVREGGVLVVSIDFPLYWMGEAEDEPPASVLAMERSLENLGIRVRRPLPEGSDTVDEYGEDSITVEKEEDNTAAGKKDGEKKGENREKGEDSITVHDSYESNAGESEDSIIEEEESPDFPDYDYRIVFAEPDSAAGPFISGGQETPPGEKSLTLRDTGGNIRLIRRTLGRGQVAVAGACVFMYNYLLDDQANARLAWELTGGSLGPGRPGILFVRGRRSAGGLFGILSGRGNLLPPVLSCLALVFAGFWITLPGFGVPLREESRRRLSITGRFSAEARFLRRHGALRVYSEIYLRELRRLSRGREPGREIKEVEEVLAAGKKIGPRKTAVYLKNLMSALERL